MNTNKIVAKVLGLPPVATVETQSRLQQIKRWLQSGNICDAIYNETKHGNVVTWNRKACSAI